MTPNTVGTTELDDDDNLITSVPLGTTVYVGFDKTDTSTAKYYPSFDGDVTYTEPSGGTSDLKLFGGILPTIPHGS